MEKNIQTKKNSVQGFTLIEILVVVGMIALLAAIVLIAINPARQFAQGRNSQRASNVNAILNAIGQRMADHKGLFREADDTVCTDEMEIPASADDVDSAVTIKSDDLDMRPCLVPAYISELPVDPAKGTVWDGTDYDTDYKIFKNSEGRITVFAPDTDELDIQPDDISVTR